MFLNLKLLLFHRNEASGFSSIIKIFARINIFKLLVLLYWNLGFEILWHYQIIFSILSLSNIFCTLICLTKNFVQLKFLPRNNLVQNLNFKKYFLFLFLLFSRVVWNKYTLDRFLLANFQLIKWYPQTKKIFTHAAKHPMTPFHTKK